MRKLSSRRLVSLLAMVLATVTSVSVGAQPTTRDHRRRVPGPPPAPTAPATPTTADSGPTEAPPTPREERQAARKGFVWIPGRWDWRSNKWEWVAGHWERERAGKSWREGRWERQGARWTYVDGAWIDASVAVNVPPVPPPTTTTTTTTPPPPVNAPPGGWPTTAPPPPRNDATTEVRRGFVWVQGEWDWRNAKWEWIPGHWERERAGKRWRAARWEQREGRWARVDGDWTDDGPSTVPGTPPPTTGPVRPRREWKLEQPVISSYWPAKGKVGSRVVIKGRNFPERAELMFAGQVVRGVNVKDKQIVFVVPPNATTGAISLRINGRRELPVGMFEVAAAFDPVAEQKRIEEEQRRKAEAAWAERQKQLAQDKAAREAAWRQRQQEREATREQRRADRVAALQARWHRAFLADEETQSELTLHAQRVAEIERMRELAELKGNGKLVIRIGIAHERETDRHDQRMAALEASFKTRGGTP